MGVDTRHYVMLGYEFTYDEYLEITGSDDELHDALLDDPNVVMKNYLDKSGFVVGEILSCSSGSRWEPSDLQPLSIDYTELVYKILDAKMSDAVVDLIPWEYFKGKQIKLVIFTQYY